MHATAHKPLTDVEIGFRQVERNARNEGYATAYRAMEGDLCDVVNMGRIAARIFSESDGPNAPQQERNLVSFAINHLEEMLIAFGEKYNNDGWHPGDEDNGVG